MTACVRCGRAFHCATVDGSDKPCWCSQLPPLTNEMLAALKTEGLPAACLCPVCLEKVAEASKPGSPATR